MDLYVILRRNGWRSAEELEQAATRSTEEGERRGDVRWIRSYVLEESDGGLGTVCVYEAESADALRAHAQDADLPVDEVVRVADTVVVRPDPVAGTA
jgi:sporulation protein YlmC with PRC-barrel domain